MAYGSGRGAGNLQARGQQFESACSTIISSNGTSQGPQIDRAMILKGPRGWV